MFAGLIVLSVPIVVFGLLGWTGAAALKRERVLRLQAQILGKALLQQAEIRHSLEQRAALSERGAADLEARNALLVPIIAGLKNKLG